MSSARAAQRHGQVHVPGLRYVNDASPGSRAAAPGKGFVYTGPNGKRIRDQAEVDRIRQLAIPPAWTDVWICPSAERPHPRDRTGRQGTQAVPLPPALAVRARRGEVRPDASPSAEALPGLRRRVRKDMTRSGLPKEKVVATVVALLDCCFARVGNEEYAKQNGSFGLTTLRGRHAKFYGIDAAAALPGQGRQDSTRSRWTTRGSSHIVRRCQAIPGQELFQYLDDDGEPASDRIVRRERLPARGHGRGLLGEGLPDVGRHGRLRPGARGGRARDRRPSGQPGGPRRGRRGGRRARQHADRLPDLLHPPGRDRRLPRRVARQSRLEAPTMGASSVRGLSADERFALAFLKSRERAGSGSSPSCLTIRSISQQNRNAQGAYQGVRSISCA